MLTPSYVLRIAVPSLIMMYSFSWGKIETIKTEETFASPSVYVSLEYVEKLSDHKIKHHFQGVFVTNDKEEPMHGYRYLYQNQIWYVFETSREQYVGWLTIGNRGCEPELHYRNQDGKTGILKAGFCL